MGLVAEIYKYKGQNWSGGGISSSVDKVVVMNLKGQVEYDHETSDRLLYRPVLLVPGDSRGAKVVPAIKDDFGNWVEWKPVHMIGPMMGGCYVGTSDSRFVDKVHELTGSYGAIVPLHDRFETQAEYDRNFD